MDEQPSDVLVGIQLVAAGSDLDVSFVSLRRLLRERRDLVEHANELKRSFEGGDPEAYIAAKGELYERLLREEI